MDQFDANADILVEIFLAHVEIVGAEDELQAKPESPPLQEALESAVSRLEEVEERLHESIRENSEDDDDS